MFAVATGGGAAFVSAANVVAEVVANVVAAAVVVDVASLESRATTSKTDVSSKSKKNYQQLNISENIRYFTSTRLVAS